MHLRFIEWPKLRRIPPASILGKKESGASTSGLKGSFIHSFIHFILPLTRNATTVYRNTLKIIYNIPTKLFTRSNVVKARKPIQKPGAYKL